MTRLRPSPATSWLLACSVGALLLHACGGDSPSDPPPGGENVVGPEGGMLTLANGDVSLDVPAGALSSTIELTVTPATGPANALAVGGATYDFGPDGTQFSQAVALEIAYAEGSIPAGIPESELRLHAAQGDAWEAIAGSGVSAGSNTVSGPITSFSVYGVAALAVQTFEVAAPVTSVEVDGTVQLETTIEAGDGTPLDRDVDWSSENEAVATVDDEGLVTAHSAGAAEIIGLVEGLEASVEITVTPDDVVGPGGGVFTFFDGRVSLDIPAGAVTSEVELSVEEDPGPANPRRVPDASYDFGPDGTAFDVSVELAIGYDESDIPAGVSESDLRLHRVEQGEWVPVEGSTLDEGGNTVEGSIDGFSVYGVAALAASSVEVSSPVAGVVAGGDVQLEGTALDGGGAPLDRDLEWSSSDLDVATVDGDGLVTTLTPGVVEITAMVDGVEASVTLTVTTDWTVYAGHWAGTWTNTTFGSSDTVDCTVTVDIATLTITFLINVDGPVLGSFDPLPFTVVGTLGATTLSADADPEDSPYGPVQFADEEPGMLMVESVNVPGSGAITGWDLTTTQLTPERHTAEFTVFFADGSEAVGTHELEKQD